MLGETLIDLAVAQRMIDGSPFGRWWGYRVEELGPGFARLLLPFQSHFERPGGVLQGGCAMTLADVSFWIAGMTVMGEDPSAVTLQMSSSFLRPATLGDLRCEARILRAGKRILYGESSVTDPRGNLLTHHVLTYMRPEPSAGA
ncbi:MAG TPA: PaaI family thioesterase [Myxococcaceae bacterium]|nr:PaaI family thioesterase [Myxococcaceae bacterium]